jgi:branched-chain amino acid transport system substrate-binding protein
VTGFSSSNTMIPVWKTFNDAGVFAVGALAGPLQFAGKDCLPNGFVVSFSNDDWPAAVGKYMTDKGVKSAFFIGADYQAGYEHVGAAMKYFKGKATGPVYAPKSRTRCLRFWSAPAASPSSNSTPRLACRARYPSTPRIRSRTR